MFARRFNSLAANARIVRAIVGLCAGATVLIGCPLYSEDCAERSDCAAGFYCDQSSQRCRPIADEIACSRPDHCELGETCTPDFTCRPGSCDYHGCVTGYICGVSDSAHACMSVEGEPGPADASVGTPPDAGGDGLEPADAGIDAAAGDASVEDTSVEDASASAP